MPDDFVRNDEILYRRIPARRKLYKIRIDGTIEISSYSKTNRYNTWFLKQHQNQLQILHLLTSHISNIVCYI